MKHKILLFLVMTLFITVVKAQKTQKITGYAITAAQKGQTGWKEVRLVDIVSGEEVESVYKGTQQVELLNARTGKPIVKKELSLNTNLPKRVVNLDMELDRKAQEQNAIRYYTLPTPDPSGQPQERRKVIVKEGKEITKDVEEKIAKELGKVRNMMVYTSVEMPGVKVSSDKPFATNSAAMAYDKKHDRLYYTPMSINQLRYIDLKSKTPKIFYFEDEPFGVVTGPGDAPNQITRMVFASDGNGYALTNNANHLIRFTTGKNPEITDLGPLTDDAVNGRRSVHSNGYGGDMVADANGNLYLIQANHNVFKFSIEQKVATWMGSIQGLPGGFSTNGAMVDAGSKVIVCSSESTVGYFRFDLADLKIPAEEISTQGDVYNASDLANGNLAFEKKKKDKKERNNPLIKEETPPVVEEASRDAFPNETIAKNNISVYPNPVTNGFVKLAFENQPAGKYQVELLDMSGKLISSTEMNINNKVQVEEFRIPLSVSKGNYLIKIYNEPNNVSVTTKLLVQ